MHGAKATRIPKQNAENRRFQMRERKSGSEHASFFCAQSSPAAPRGNQPPERSREAVPATRDGYFDSGTDCNRNASRTKA